MKKSLESETAAAGPPLSPRSRLSRSMSANASAWIAAGMLGTAAVLEARVLLFQGGTGGILLVARAALPALLGLAALLSLAASGGKSLLSAIAPREGSLLGILLAVWTAALAATDIAAGFAPAILVPGCAALALIYWDRAALLYACCASSLCLGLGSRFLLPAGVPQPALAETLFLAFCGAALAVTVERTVRANVLPSAERLKSLEQENRKLWNLSFRDGLTGLYNRRFAQEAGLNLFSRSLRYREQLHVLMIDIDRFKKVNDRLGHAQGDEVLGAVAQLVQSGIRASDVAARYGGEEFLVFLVKAEPELVQNIANRIRDSVATHAFPEVPWKVTISIGVAGLRDGDSFEGLVARSDSFLYQSKQNGRNRVSGT